MKHYELLVEHRYKDTLLRSRRLKPSSAPFTIGSARNSRLRLLGEEVGGVHATIEFQNDHWVILDLGSGNGTWMQKDAICEEVIHQGSVMRIGSHEIRLTPIEREVDLFSAEEESLSSRGEKYHQVVIRRQGRVVQTHLLPSDQTFEFLSGREIVKFAPPSTFAWTTKSVGNFEIRQRLVKNNHSIQQIDFSPQTLFSPDFRVPVVTTIAVFCLIFLAILLAPHMPHSNLQTMTLDNPYSKMIYDAKLTRQMRKDSQQLSHKMEAYNRKLIGTAGNGTPTPRSGRVSAANEKLIQRIKASGLSQLIGKISKRASQNAILFQALGQDASNTSTGMVGSIAGVAKSVGAKAHAGGGGAFHLGGIGTLGKGGGVNVNRGIAGIGEGGVGQGQVGLVEEEGDVEGGLDKDVIARYIKSQLGQIRYCYERQLSANPDLYGKVQIRFVIGPTGSVVQQMIGSSTLKSAMVEGCILRRVAEWKFPIPKGGTSVIVTYPFLFKSTN